MTYENFKIMARKMAPWILILGGAALAVWVYPPLLKVAWRVGGFVCLVVGVVICVIMGLLVAVLQLVAFLAIAQIGIRGNQGANMLVFFLFLCLSALLAIVSAVYDILETEKSSILPWMLGLQLLLGILSIIFQGLFYGKKRLKKDCRSRAQSDMTLEEGESCQIAALRRFLDQPHKALGESQSEVVVQNEKEEQEHVSSLSGE